MAKLFLFDVDKTLVDSRGAGGRAMTAAFAQLFGIADGFAGIGFTGRTDTAIFRDAVNAHSLDGEFPTLLARFQETYFSMLPRTLTEVQAQVLSGVHELLAGIQAAPGASLGLATGNFRESARLKLEPFGLYDFFLAGGFADDSEDRAEVVAIAIERLAEASGGPDPREVYVIGDTPLDIAAAEANGARSIAVATGFFSVDELTTAGADVVFPDFSSWQAVLDALLG
ncbi:MAG: HAD hydrolase-like protein [Dehalococcoidia bacterium]|nr:MAG: HAD hydrolase-like protein [Dehalococcoidia bacterium]